MAGLEGLEVLSDGDKAVVRSIFDPTATIGEVVDDGDTFVEEDPEPTSDSEKQSVSLITQAVRLADEGKQQEALELMNQAVKLSPNRAACYNDRAQLLRLMFKDDEAMLDLDNALELTKGTRTRARAQALCQKGMLLKKRQDNALAKAAFAEAADLGSGFAKKQMAELNPYAALCNRMLSQVMRGENNIQL